MSKTTMAEYNPEQPIVQPQATRRRAPDPTTCQPATPCRTYTSNTPAPRLRRAAITC